MSVGRRGDKTYTGFNGARTDTLRGKDKLRSPHAGAADRIIAPTPASMRKAIEDGVCPFCPAGPFKNLGVHTYKAHGYSANEVKNMAGIPKSHPICDPGYSETHRRIGREKGKLPNIAYRRANNKPRVFSPGGLEVQRQKLQKVRETWKPTGGTKSQAQHASRARVAKLASEVWPEMDRQVLDLFNTGTYLSDIAEATGFSIPAVRRSLKRSGVEGDLRGRRSSVQARNAATLPARLAGSKARADRLAAVRLARFRELGGDWPAVRLLAEELGIQQKAARAWLAKRGVEIDGRRAPERTPT